MYLGTYSRVKSERRSFRNTAVRNGTRLQDRLRCLSVSLPSVDGEFVRNVAQLWLRSNVLLEKSIGQRG
jgi:hypothetical protein